MKWERLNKNVCVMPSYQLFCTSCGSECQILDCIDGNLFTDAAHIYCPVCGNEISMGKREAA